MSWTNGDGLYVKFDNEQGATMAGGEVNAMGGDHVYEFVIDYTDALSATASILGSASGTTTGSYGVMLPKGLLVTEIETTAQTAFTSSGTIGSADMTIGLIRDDRSTTYDVDGLTTASFAGSLFDATGETKQLIVGSTGAGALVGTVLANDGLIVVANSGHASHPFTAGKLLVKVRGKYPYAAHA